MLKVTGSPRRTLLESAVIFRDVLCACAIAVPMLTTSAYPTIANKIAKRLMPFS
jgi:hypothetical protein